MHWTLCKHTWLQVIYKCYERTPERGISVNGTTIMWNIPVITERTILTNRPDIVLHYKKEKTCLLIDIIAISDGSNINAKKLLLKTKQVQILGERVQQGVGSEDKNCASYNWSIRNHQELFRSKTSVAVRSPVGRRSTQNNNNEHCTQLGQIALISC
jgi:hypothetical protein